MKNLYSLYGGEFGNIYQMPFDPEITNKIETEEWIHGTD